MTESPTYRPDPLAVDYRPQQLDPQASRLLAFPDLDVSSALDGDAGLQSTSVTPSTAAARARESRAASAATGAAAPPTAPAPTPATPATKAQRAPGAPPPRQTTTPGAAPRSGRNPWQPAPGTPWATGNSAPGARSGCGPKVAGLIGLALLVPLVGAFVALMAERGGDDETDRPSPDVSASQTQVVQTPVAITPSNGQALPVAPSEIRFEVQGDGRSPSLSLYVDGNRSKKESVTLPYGVSVPIDEDTSFASIHVSDYDDYDNHDGENGPPLQCRAYVDDVLVSFNSGTTSADCTVTSASMPRN